MIRSASALLLLTSFVACGPPMKAAQHPGLTQFGSACTDAHTCANDLECMRAGGYGGESGSCEKRCNYDDDCGLDARCKMVEGASSPVCRQKG